MHAETQFSLFRLRPGYAVIPQADGVQLRAGDEDIHLLQGDDLPLLGRLLTALEEPQTIASLTALFGEAQRPLIDAVLEQLAAMHCLQRDAPEGDLQARFLQHVAAGNPQACSLPVDATVHVLGHAPFTEVLAAVLRDLGIQAELSANVSIGNVPLICAVEQPDLARMLDANAVAIAARRPCLFVDLSHGRHATVGPFFIPDEGACYHCYRIRRRQNTASIAEFDAADARMLESHKPLPAFGTLPAFRSWIASIAAAEVLAFFTRHRPLRTLNQATVIALEEFTQTIEPVWRVPWCSACGRKSDAERA